MNKKILALIFFSAIAGGILSSALFMVSAEANVFKDFYEQYLKPLINKKDAIKNNETNQPSKTEPYIPTVDYEEKVIKAVESASPAVISIIISKDLPIIEQCPYNPFSDLPGDFQDIFGGGFEFYQPCQKGTEKKEIGGGSGFIISFDGLIATNKHVVSDTKASYTVLTNDGKKYDAEVLARDPARDFAVLKIKADNLPILKLGDSDSIRLGQTAIAIGNALGEFRNTVSVGVISGLARNITASGGGAIEKIEGVIQTDAAINQGNSGGPLLNLKGEAIGISVATALGAQNIGFAIPINQVKKSIESIKKTGRIITPYLGIRYIAINSELAKKEKLLIEDGLIIRGNEDGPGVVKDSPAYKSGLLAEDIIIELNDEKITQEKSLTSLLQKYGVGEEIVLKIIRGGKEIEIKVKLEERPKGT